MKNLMSPAFKGKIVLPVVKIMKQSRKNEVFWSENQFTVPTQMFFQENGLNVEHRTWNYQKAKKRYYETFKEKIEYFFSEKFVDDLDWSEYGKSCWSNFRFK